MQMPNLQFLLEYFNSNYGIRSLGQLTWAHAVNNEAELATCLNDDRTMFIEADVCLSSTGLPIMAHPPSKESDLTLANLLKQLQTSKQGIKLDFKDWGAVAKGLYLLNKIKLQQPVILNADILKGTGAKLPKVPAHDFIQICQTHFPNGIISLGWTTVPNNPYTEEIVDGMISTASSLDVVLFPVRASLVQSSWSELQKLIPDERPGWALSFWNAKDEPPTPAFIRWLKNEAKPSRALYDLMDENKNSILVLPE